jgi:alpha-amylase/alpha-mannosidase (GH57 family)
MSDENLDLNITNYTTKDLLKILDLYDGGDDDNLDSISKEDIIEKTNQYITKFSNENEQDMVVFFKEIQNNLINAIDDYDNSNNHENTIIPSDKLS